MLHELMNIHDFFFTQNCLKQHFANSIITVINAVFSYHRQFFSLFTKTFHCFYRCFFKFIMMLIKSPWTFKASIMDKVFNGNSLLRHGVKQKDLARRTKWLICCFSHPSLKLRSLPLFNSPSPPNTTLWKPLKLTNTSQ